jgi:hypothetical protein
LSIAFPPFEFPGINAEVFDVLFSDYLIAEALAEQVLVTGARWGAYTFM